MDDLHHFLSVLGTRTLETVEISLHQDLEFYQLSWLPRTQIVTEAIEYLKAIEVAINSKQFRLNVIDETDARLDPFFFSELFFTNTPFELLKKIGCNPVFH